jgi:hypothetical protein
MARCPEDPTRLPPPVKEEEAWLSPLKLDEITIRKKRKLFPGSPITSPVLFALLLKAFLENFFASPSKANLCKVDSLTGKIWKGGAPLLAHKAKDSRERRR